MTQDVYVNRKTVGGTAGSLLTEIAATEPPEKDG